MSYQSTYSQHNKHLSSSNTFTKILFFSAPSKSLYYPLIPPRYWPIPPKPEGGKSLSSAPSKSLSSAPSKSLYYPLIPPRYPPIPPKPEGGKSLSSAPSKSLSSAPSKSLFIPPPFNYLFPLAETNVINSMRAIVLYFFIIFIKIYF